MEQKIRILYIDKEEHNLRAFYAHFRTESKYEIFICQLPEEGIEILRNQQIHILIIDQLSPFAEGTEFLKEANVLFREPAKIVVTAQRDSSVVERAKKQGLIFHYYDKPYVLDHIKTSIDEGYKLYFKN